MNDDEKTDPAIGAPPAWVAETFATLSGLVARFEAAAARLEASSEHLESALADYRTVTRRLEALEAQAAQ
jgi:hypothetical protein